MTDPVKAHIYKLNPPGWIGEGRTTSEVADAKVYDLETAVSICRGMRNQDGLVAVPVRVEDLEAIGS
jgi:hypothetical protein